MHLLIFFGVCTAAVFIIVLQQHIAEAKKENHDRNIIFHGRTVSAEEMLRQIMMEEEAH